MCGVFACRNRDRPLRPLFVITKRNKQGMLLTCWVILVISSHIVFTGCGDSRAEASRLPGGEDLPRWQVAASPSLVLGVVDGAAPYQFDGIEAVRRRSDGSIVVADGGSSELRVYDPGGRYLFAVGGSGGGPGEFESISRIFVLAGDSIGAWDSRQKRFTVFTPKGSLARTETLSDIPGMGGPLDAIFADGSMVARSGINPLQLMASEEGVRRLSVTHLLRAAGATDWRRMEGFAGREELVIRTDRFLAALGILFGRDHVVAAGRSRWYTGDTHRFEVTVRAPDGAEILRLRRNHTPVPVTDADLARAQADYRSRREQSRQDIVRRMGAAAVEDEPVPPHRATMPAFDNVIEDVSENVWVRHYHFPADARQRWSVFAPTGELIADVETPSELRIHEIGSGSVVGTTTDELGVQYVQVHSLDRLYRSH